MTTKNRRFVLDTNAIVSAALLKNSVSRKAFDKAHVTGQIVVSIPVIEELNSVLKRTKFDKYLTEAERLQFLESFVRDTSLITITTTVTECRDPKDNKFLELAVNGHAHAIISGDEDLTVLNPFRGIPVLTPGQFLEYEWRDED